MKTQLISLAVATMLLSFTNAPVSSNIGTAGINTKKPAASVFSSFRTHRQGKGVTAVWDVASNAGVVGFVLQKTYEDATDPYAVWEDVNAVPCTGNRSYKFTDTSVFPGTITYRVSAQLADGSSVQSGNSSARIVSH